MGTSATLTTADGEKRRTWKVLLIKAAGFGIGVTFALALVIGITIWWSERPKPSKPWNKTAVKAHYNALTEQPDKNKIWLTFSYSLDNTTDLDYRVPSLHLMQRLEDDVLEEAPGQWIVADTFVPAHQKVKFSFTVPQENTPDVTATSGDERDIKIASRYLKNIHGFVAFDETNRYEIDLPSGWESIKEPGADDLKRK